MSFCSEVKNELIAIRPQGCCKPSYAYGFMLFGRSFSFKAISLQTANENVAKAYCDLIYELYKIRPEIKKGGDLRPTFCAKVISESDRLKILASVDFGIGDVIDRTAFLRECCIESFVRGAFLACGNINNPEKEYRAEFNVKSDKLAEELRILLSENGIEMKKISRGKGAQLYTKESTAVEDLLTFMGAGKKTLDIIDTKIMKSVKNKTNRARNCDSANIEKTVEASFRQRKAIDYLIKNDRFASLTPELKFAAQLRINNPDATLTELCKISGDEISVSGLNRRLKKIVEIYEEMIQK